MRSTSFVVPAAELPLLEKSLVLCPSITLLAACPFSIADQAYYDVYLECLGSGDIYALGALVGKELELLEGSLVA